MNKYEILQEYMNHHNSLAHCVKVLDDTTSNNHKYYENCAKALSVRLALMEKQNPFLVEVIKLIDETE
jgi:hypothetical protein